MITFSPEQRARLVAGTGAALVVAVSFVFNRHYPESVLSGENSTGTWLSVFLLAGSCTATLIIGMQRTGFCWWVVSAFFFMLALDERFMFHERLKQYIVFSSADPASVPFYLAEAGVLGGIIIGASMACLMWKHTLSKGRLFLVLGVAFGSLSAILDIADHCLFLEDLCKLLGETMVFMYLLGEIAVAIDRKESGKRSGRMAHR
jgi:hypothetical protein